MEEDDPFDIPAFLRLDTSPQALAECRAKIRKQAVDDNARFGRLGTRTFDNRPFDPYQHIHQATRREKARVRIEKMLARKSGAASQPPLEGKAALAAIKQAEPLPRSRLRAVGVNDERRIGMSKLEQLRAMREKEASKAKPKKRGRPPKEAKAPKEAKPKRNGNATPRKRDGSKTQAVAALLKRAKGASRAEILEATGWPSVSVQAMADAAGLKLSTNKKEKEKGEPLRYFGS